MAFLATPLVFPLGGGGFVSTSVDVWARDLLAVTFVEPMRVDALLRSAGAYSVVAEDGIDPVVLDVFVGHSAAATTVWLVVDATRAGTNYIVQFQNLYAVTGLAVSPSSSGFIGRDTKIDLMVDSRPQMYDMRPRSRYRWLFNAIGREDDLIGGSRHDRLSNGELPFVIPPTLLSIVITPANPSIPLTLTQQMVATGHYSDSTTADITNDVLWASSDPTKVSIVSSGLATADGAGTATLSAVQGSVIGTTTATVGALVAPVVSSYDVYSGNPGGSVVITGLNFFAITSVDFNGTPAASYNVDSSTQITAVIPVGFATGPINVTNTAGTGTGPIFGTTETAGAWLIPNTSTTGASHALYWRTIYVPTDVTAITLVLANRLYNGGTGSPVTLPQVAIGESDGAGGFASAPTIYTTVVVPGDGTKVTLPTTGITRGADGNICIAFEYPGGGGTIPVAYCANLFVGHYHSAGSQLFPMPGFDGNDTNPLFQIWVGYTTARPRYVVLGDSILVGGSTSPLTCGYAAAAWPRLAADFDLAVSVSGLPGGFLHQFSLPLTYPALWDQENVAGATVVVQAGVNDSATDTAATMLANFELIAAHARSLGATRVIATTVLPNITSGYGPAANTQRLLYNAGLLTSSADAVIDICPAVWDESNHDKLADWANSGDGLHPNGQANVEIEAVIAAAEGLSYLTRTSGSLADFVLGSLPGDRVTLQPIPLTSDAGDVTLMISNDSATYPATPHGPAISGVNIAVYPADSSFLPVGTAAVAVWLNQTIPAGGTGFWLAPSTFSGQAARGSNGYMVVLVGAPSGAQMCITLGVPSGSYKDGTATVEPPPGSWTGLNPAVTLTTTAVYPSARRPIICIGDSIVGAYALDQADPRLQDSGFVKVGVDNNHPVDALSVPGSTMQQWSGADPKPYYKFNILGSGAVWVIQPFINSLPTFSSVADYWAQVDLIVAYINSKYTPHAIVLCTGIPSNTYTFYDALRQSINADIRINFGAHGIDAIYDMAVDFETPGSPSIPRAGYYQADDTHPNRTPGHSTIATNLFTVLSPLL